MIEMNTARFRLMAGAATIAAAAAGIGTFAATAGASSTACTSTGKLAGSCGTEALANGSGWAVQASTAKAGALIVAANSADTSGRADFYAAQSNANASERVFEYAPLGKESGLCVTALTNGSLDLAKCANSASQEWYGLGDTQADQDNANDGIQWLNAQSGKVAMIFDGGVVLGSLDATANASNSYFHWVG